MYNLSYSFYMSKNMLISCLILIVILKVNGIARIEQTPIITKQTIVMVSELSIFSKILA